jgi:hypothetical protein
MTPFPPIKKHEKPVSSSKKGVSPRQKGVSSWLLRKAGNVGLSLKLINDVNTIDRQKLNFHQFYFYIINCQ